jgi:hypothetical protein
MAIIVHIKLINTPIEICKFANLGKKLAKQLDSGRKLVKEKAVDEFLQVLSIAICIGTLSCIPYFLQPPIYIY